MLGSAGILPAAFRILRNALRFQNAAATHSISASTRHDVEKKMSSRKKNAENPEIDMEFEV